MRVTPPMAHFPHRGRKKQLKNRECAGMIQTMIQFRSMP